jgi:hypothetical protein
MTVPDEIEVYVSEPGRPDNVRGTVARILNEREIVINRGSNHGVKVGMQFAVLDPDFEELVDPETGDPLGEIDVPKAFLKTTRVAANFSVASTFRTFTVGGGPLRSLLDNPVTQVEELETDSSTLKGEREHRRAVNVGDPVVQARHDQYAGWD